MPPGSDRSQRRSARPPSGPGDVLVAQPPQPPAPSDARAERDGASTDARLARLAAGQRGVVTRRQALAAGVGAGAIRDRLRRGALHPLHRGVYLVGHPVPAPLALEQAALLAAGPSAVLVRRTAAALWRLTDPPPAVEVLVAGRQARARAGLVIRRTVSPLAASDLRRIDGLPVTSPARTVVDLAGELDGARLERLVHEAQVRRLASPQAVRAALDRAGPVRGAAGLRRILEAARPGVTRSEAERLLTRILRGAELPPPRRNVVVGRYELDALWPGHRVVVEVDGWQFHGTRQAFERDRRRDMELQALGYRVVRVTWRQMRDEPLAVVARLAALLARTSPGDPAAAGP